MVVSTVGPAYQAYEGSSQLIVPTLNFAGRVVSSRTVHAEFRPDLSFGRSVWQAADGTLYHVVKKEQIIH